MMNTQRTELGFWLLVPKPLSKRARKRVRKVKGVGQLGLGV